MLPAFQGKEQIVKQFFRPEGFCQSFHLQTIITAYNLGREFHAHVRPRFGRLLQDIDFLEHFFPAFRPADGLFPVKGTQLFDNRLLMPDFLLLVHIGIPSGRTQLFFFYRIVGVIPMKDGDLRAVYFNNFIGYFIQKIPVVGNDKYCALIIQQVGFQPRDGRHIQMVGRFIQNDEIRLAQQKLAQGNPGFLPSGKRGGLFGKFFLRKTKSLEDTGDFAFIAIAVRLFKLMRVEGILFHKGCEGLPLDMLHFQLTASDFFLQPDDVPFHLQQLVIYGIFAV